MLEHAKSATHAGLHYHADTYPGIRRVGHGKTFAYFWPNGRAVRDVNTLARIRSLVIPPAWKNVWISLDRNGHLQVTGRDARGRKQYRYHRRWRQTRDTVKYERLVAFANALPTIRRRVKRDLARRGLPRQKVTAAVVRLLETTLIRVGNKEYARNNHSFGLTTMRDGHARINGSKMRFRFRGKSGVERGLELESAQLARIVKRCQDLPGQELFQYIDKKGQVRDIGSTDVNAYLRDACGKDVSAKDFRTWAGTVLAAEALREFEDFDSDARAKRNITHAIERVARRLGNTKAVCRSCYVHPAIVEAYLERSLIRELQRRTETELKGRLRRLSAEEAAVLAFLQARMKLMLRVKRRCRISRHALVKAGRHDLKSK